MAYRVCVSEGFIRPLPSLIRGCIRSELEWVAQMAEKNTLSNGTNSEALPIRPLPNGYWMSYRRDDRARTVKLIVVGQPKTAATTH